MGEPNWMIPPRPFRKDDIDLYSAGNTTVVLGVGGNLAIRQSLGPPLNNMFLSIDKDDWHDFVKAVNTANLILKKKEVRDG